MRRHLIQARQLLAPVVGGLVLAVVTGRVTHRQLLRWIEATERGLQALRDVV